MRTSSSHPALPTVPTNFSFSGIAASNSDVSLFITQLIPCFNRCNSDELESDLQSIEYFIRTRIWSKRHDSFANLESLLQSAFDLLIIYPKEADERYSQSSLGWTQCVYAGTLISSSAIIRFSPPITLCWSNNWLQMDRI